MHADVKGMAHPFLIAAGDIMGIEGATGIGERSRQAAGHLGVVCYLTRRQVEGAAADDRAVRTVQQQSPRLGSRMGKL